MTHSLPHRSNRAWRLITVVVVIVLGWAVHRLIVRLPVTVHRDQKILVDGVERSYRLVVPDAPGASSPVPLLVALHGAGDTTEQMAVYTDLDRLAARHGFCLVYLQGSYDSWPPFIPEQHPEVVDREIAFFDATCDEILSRYPVDARRIYVTGMSQGAAFVHVVVAMRSERIAAAASHSGWLPDPLGETGVDTQYKCPILFVVGADDRQVSPESVAEAQACFAAAGHPTELMQLEGVGHRWAKDRGINETIWQFLSGHELPEG
jgi:poly(3-hydroxybutyrate) depolymerase